MQLIRERSCVVTLSTRYHLLEAVIMNLIEDDTDCEVTTCTKVYDCFDRLLENVILCS